MFGCLERHAKYWLGRAGSDPLPVVGAEPASQIEAPPMDGAHLAQSFCNDLRNLQGVLEPILRAETVAALNRTAERGADHLEYSDELWVSTVYDLVIALRRGIMSRDHIMRALAPLYLGRTGSFLMRYGDAAPEDVAGALESLSLEFERRKPELADRWNETGKG